MPQSDDGILFRRADHLVARDAQEGDTDFLGRDVPAGKKVFVRRQDCKEMDRGVDPSVADPIPQIHVPSSDYRAYGHWRHQKKRDDGRWIEGEYYEEYYTCPVYEARGSSVLQGTIYSTTDPRAEAIAEAGFDEDGEKVAV
jgi:hypothetical protein